MLSFFCFSKLGAPLFSFFLSRPETSISGENPCSNFEKQKKIEHFEIWKKTHFFFSKSNPNSEKYDFVCFSGGCTWPPEIGKTWIFTGNGRFRTRQKKPEKRSSQLWETKKWEHFQIWGKLTFFLFFSHIPHRNVSTWPEPVSCNLVPV